MGKMKCNLNIMKRIMAVILCMVIFFSSSESLTVLVHAESESALDNDSALEIEDYDLSIVDEDLREDDTDNIQLQNESEDGWTYNLLEDDKICITGYTGKVSEDLIIPEQIDDKEVTEIGKAAFKDRVDFIGTLVIPECITKIEEDAFSGCICIIKVIDYSNAKVVLPEEEGKVWRDAYAKGIGDIKYLMNGVAVKLNAKEEDPTCEFKYCYLNDGNISIIGYNGKPSGDLIIPETINEKSVTVIGDSAFKDCTGFTGSLTIPGSVEYICDSAFSGCTGFTGTLTIPRSLDTIFGSSAFKDCVGFTKVINNSNEMINLSYGEGIWWNEDTQTIIDVIKGTIYWLGNGTFIKYDTEEDDPTGPFKYICLGEDTICIIGYKEGASGELQIPEKINGKDVTAISARAFDGYNGDGGNLTIPSCVTTISDDAFYRSTGFTKVINNSDDSFILPSIAGKLWLNENSGIVTNSLGKETVTLINAQIDDPNCNFKYCYLGNDTVCITGYKEGEIEELIIPEMINGKSVTEIGDNAFGSGVFSGNLTIPNSVTTIGDSAFDYCEGFNGYLKLGDSVTTIGANAFTGCGFKGTLTIPDSVKKIGSEAFSYCSGFSGDLTIPDSVTSIGDYAFGYCSGFNGNLTIGNSVKTIEFDTFTECNGFKGNLTIGNSVETIENFAFASCSGFTGGLTIPDSVTFLDSSAFNGCKGFTGNLTLGSNVKTIKDCVFEDCGFTGELTIPESVKTIGPSAFENCSGFNGLSLENGVTEIAAEAFKGCYGFAGGLTVPNSVSVIGQSAFNGCRGFRGELILPDSITTIGWSAFYGCKGFTKVINNSDYNLVLPVVKGKTWHDSNKEEIITSIKKGTAIRNDYAPLIFYSVKFDSQGSTEIESQTVSYGNTITLPVVTKAGYLFGGWYTKPFGRGVQYTENTRIREDVTLYAYWIKSKEACKISDATVKEIVNQTYTGDAITPALTIKYQKVILKAGIDYTVTYQDNKNVGTAKAVICGIGNCVGTKNVEFTIIPKKISKAAIEVYDAAVTGKEITPTIIIMDGTKKLEQETDYQITKLINNTKPGKASVTISGNGNYAGSTINKTFLIYKAGILPISSTEISFVDGQVPKEGFIYSDKAYKPEIVLKDVSGNTIDKKNYTVSYKNNKNAGTASVIVKGKEKVYKGSKTLYFTIQPKSIVKDYSIGKITDIKFTGGLITPTATVSLNGTKKKLVNKKEYSLSYENNLVAGTATILVTGKGNYTGSLMSTFHIQAIPLGKGFSVKGLKTQKYTGSELKPVISLVYKNQTLVKERDYTVTYQNNVQIGKATMTIQAVEGSGLTGSMTKTFKIRK